MSFPKKKQLFGSKGFRASQKDMGQFSFGGKVVKKNRKLSDVRKSTGVLKDANNPSSYVNIFKLVNQEIS